LTVLFSTDIISTHINSVLINKEAGMSESEETRYWVGVVSREHVLRGVDGGFAQLCHGREAPLRRLRPGDWLVYYSPAERMGGKQPLQAFTALGRVRAGEIYPHRMSEDFVPYRRDVDYLPCTPAPIRPLLGELGFIRDPARWGAAFRFGQLRIEAADFHRIAQAMGVSAEVLADG
jgi:hypothetical protein